jgi:RecA/RadA recombinase
MGLIRQLITNNDDKVKYCFVLDSVDGLIRKDDLGKNFEESSKVAGGAVIASDFCKKVSTALGKRGHMAIFISQVRADIKLDPYAKAPVRQTTATGGNALLHFANNIMEFEPRFKGDLIIGHHAKVTIKKSAHENTNTTVSYPIRYGRTGGTSIWIEKEVIDLLYAWEFVEKKGAWIKPTEDFKELLDSNKLDFPEKIQGDNNLFKTVEENKDLCKFLIDYFKEQIGA